MTTRTWRAVIGTELVVATVLRVAVLSRGLVRLDRVFVPDDSYYTLAISRSLAHLHGPTADGHTLTSGFQPLIAFVAAPVFRITNDRDAAALTVIALLLVCDVALVFLLASLARRIAGPVAGVVTAGIWAVSPVAVRLAAGGLETTLALAAEAALVCVWLWMFDQPSRRRAAAVGAVAAVAVLARVDAIALVALLFVAHLWRGPRRLLAPAAGAFVLVLAPWWGYCLVRFGSPIPGSGAAAHALQVGHPWSRLTTSVAGAAVLNGPFAVWSRIEGRLGNHGIAWPYWTAIAAFATATVGAFVVSRRAHDPRDGIRAVVAAALCAFAALLLVFYGWFNVPYYVSRYLAPVVMVEALVLGAAVAAVARAVGGALPRASAISNRRTGWTSALVAGGVTLGVAAGGVALLCRPLWTSGAGGTAGGRFESATGYREQALLVDRLVPRGQVVGAAQSGALSYYAGERHEVVNLDGVVDADAARARRDGEIGTYLLRRHVTWLADWSLNVAYFGGEAEKRDPLASFTVVWRRGYNGQPEFVVATRGAHA